MDNVSIYEKFVIESAELNGLSIEDFLHCYILAYLDAIGTNRYPIRLD